VQGGEQLDVRPELAVCADRDGRDVECDQVVVGERSRSHADVFAVIDVERRFDDGALTQRAEQPRQDRSGGRLVTDGGAVVVVSKFHRALCAAGIFRILGDVPITCEHALTHAARVIRANRIGHIRTVPTGTGEK